MKYAPGKNPNSRNGFRKGHPAHYLKGVPPSRKGAKHSNEARLKMSRAKKKIFVPQLFKKGESRFVGEKHWNWKGGLTPINARVRHSLEYKLWRDAVFKRDKYTCVWCRRSKEVSGKLNADHIKPFAFFPELRFSIDNGRTLCEDCHKKTDTYFNKIRWQ